MTITNKKGAAIVTASFALIGALLWSNYGDRLTPKIARLMQDPQVRDWDPYPPITMTVSAELPRDRTVQVGELRASFATEPERPVAGSETKFIWTLTDKEGKSVELHRIMHGIPMHVYAVRDDLADETIHMHPPQQEGTAVWRDRSTFGSTGAWRVHMQGTLNGVLYEFWTPLEVVGPDTPATPLDAAKTRHQIDFDVRLEIPERVRAGTPVPVRFDVRHILELTPEQIEQFSRSRHNLIIAKQGSPVLWNHHGDGTVDGVAKRAPVTVIRRATPGDPFSYDFTFPSPGVWLVYFEYLSGSASFIVTVE